ncbi:MAG: M14 family metallopeptidase [Cellvibrionaceae bacterium]|nr:M14 family metallopeptidase [Cellvibrionaceae bacterium]
MSFSQIRGPLANAVSNTYLEARSLFLNTATDLACEIESYKNPHVTGINGEDLFCDVALYGAKHASKKIIISSGVHGVEAYCGSAMQILLMQQLMPHNIHKDIQLIFVHAINPYGFSHYTRNNENNIDLNRNFIDFSVSRIATEEETRFIDQAYPEHWKSADLTDILKNINQYIKLHSWTDFQGKMTQGQYHWPQAPYFGGHTASWSNQAWREICAKHAKHCNKLIHMDLHTGLGPKGACELIYTGKPENLELTKKVFPNGQVIAPGSADSSTPDISGPLCCGLLDCNPAALCVALEFGTVPIDTMLSTVIEANWLYNNPDCAASLKAEIQEKTLAAFFIDEQQWLEDVWEKSKTYFDDALQHLAETES